MDVTFPAEYQAKELAGKKALFKVKINEIKEKVLPELNDEFASEVSEYETLKEYKAGVKKDLEAQKEKYAAQQNENAVVDAVVQNAAADVPEAMIESTTENMINEYAQRLQSQGIPFDQYMKITGTTMDQLKEQMRGNAVKNIMTNLVLEAIAAKEKIEAKAEEIDEQIKKMAGMYQMEADKVKEILGEEGLKNVEADVKCQKTIDMLVAEAKLTAKAKKAEKEDAAEKPAKKPAAKKTAAKKAEKE